LAAFPEPPSLVLTGGDPLKRPDIYQLAEWAFELGLDVAITPSATPLVTREAIARLRQAGVSRLAISLDGVDAASHDAVRGVRGSFDRSLEILHDARDLGLSTQVNTTLTPSNVATVEQMAELLAALGIAMWSVFFLVPVGRATAAPRLTADQCEAAFERLWLQSLVQPYFIKTTEAPHYRRFVRQRHAAVCRESDRRPPSRFTSAHVNDGKGVMFISHMGAVYPSGFMPIPCGIFPANNVVEVYQQSPVFRALRDENSLSGKCGRCEFRKICGGSRARAFALTGDPFAEEPDCSYVPPSGFVRER
jgi:radical SAM protein with 4Fe4S-binding SPASM domain